jgi:hypothetical protein
MCKVSDKLKLCTCSKIDKKTNPHFWELQRPWYEAGIENAVGLIHAPVSLDFLDEQHNKNILYNLLNDGSCFDVALKLENKDILELHFKVNDEEYQSQYLTYAYVYSDGKWEESHYDAFGNNLRSEKEGCIQHAFS